MKPQLGVIIAGTLGLEPDQITDDLAYQSVPQWDSLRHVALMVVLEGVLNTRINNDLMVELVSVGAIRDFAETCAAANAKTPAGS